MKKQNNKNIDFLTSIGTVILIMGSLFWSVGLMARSLWKTTSQDYDIESINSKKTTAKDLIKLESYQSDRFDEVKNVPTGLFRYGGSAAWAPIRLLIDSAIQAERPEFQLRYVDNNDIISSSSSRIEMLLEKELTFIQSSYPLEDRDYSEAEKLGLKLKQIPVAIDAIAIAVHPDLNIPGLSVEQLKSIYSGEILNWQELGGPNLEITAYSRPIQSDGTVEFFIEYILKGEKLGSNIKFVSTTTEGLQQLANTPGGIYYASAPLIVRQCSIAPLPISQVTGEFIPPYQEPILPRSLCPQQRNKLNIDAFQKRLYPLTRYLYVVVKENGGVEEQAGEAYGSFLRTNQAQELIFRAGFVPLR